MSLFLTLVFLFSLAKRRMATTIITGPIIFTLAGILIFVAYPPLLERFPDWTELSAADAADPFFLLVGEITLVFVLFSEAAHIRLLEGDEKEDRMTVRLLFIALPLAVIFGAALAMVLLTDMPIWTAAVLATILAPTDASLGLAVVQSKRVPRLIRQVLTMEGGLNDGLGVPLLLFFIALSAAGVTGGLQSWLLFALRQIGFGVLVGLGVGWLGGKLMVSADRRGWMDGKSRQLALLSMAVLAWALSEHGLHGNGFIAAFHAGIGLLLSYRNTDQPQPHFDEAWVDLLIYFIFFYFGISVCPALSFLTGQFWLYAILSLTLVRMVPVAISMIGVGLRPASTLFLGWFGPRGLAAIILALIYLEEVAHIGINVNMTILLAGAATVLLSLVAHGVSAIPGINLYAHQLTDLKPGDPESTAYDVD
jgi:NhaP-type Na+/H+ or K+/H+ antiporter